MHTPKILFSALFLGGFQDRQEHCHNKITSNEYYEEGIKHSHLSSDDLFHVKEELTNLEIIEKNAFIIKDNLKLQKIKD